MASEGDRGRSAPARPAGLNEPMSRNTGDESPSWLNLALKGDGGWMSRVGQADCGWPSVNLASTKTSTKGCWCWNSLTVESEEIRECVAELLLEFVVKEENVLVESEHLCRGDFGLADAV